MKRRFSLIRRGKIRYVPAAPKPEPVEERQDIPFPEGGARRHVDIPEVATVRVDRPRTVMVEGFTPLPRCSHCGTAVAHSQVVCHGCGRGLGKL